MFCASLSRKELYEMNRLAFVSRFACLALCFALFAPSVRAATWYVATTGSDSNLGTTAAKPFLTIQQGVNYANLGDTVLVADGTYSGAKNYNIDFGGVDLTVKSASGNPANCVIDCQKLGCAFYLHSGETAKSNIASFTIENGAGNSNNGGNGGGIYISSNKPTVNNCVFTSNTANQGGGMEGGTATNCTFSNNNGGGMYAGTAINCAFTGNYGKLYGGGMENGTATNCVFTGNSAIFGGGMEGVTATNCIFTGNIAQYGGGMDSGTATNCAFISNYATVGGGGTYDGTATNCVFFGNAATQYISGGTTTPANGGGAYAANLYFCTVVNNSAQGSGGGVYSSSLSATTNCIIWGNTAVVGGLNVFGSGTVTYSDVQRGFNGTGNINADPKFVNQASGNLHLTAASTACVNAGTSATAYPFNTFPTTDGDGGKRTIGAKPDMGAYEYGNVGFYGTLAFDGIYAAAPAQIVTFRFRPTTGADINMTYFTTADGAFYLYGIPNGSYMMRVKSPTYLAVVVPITVAGGVASITAALEPGDANNDNSCDSSDFGVLIGAFNTMANIPGSGYDPTADFNGDGVVDSTDFGLLIGNFNTVGAP